MKIRKIARTLFFSLPKSYINLLGITRDDRFIVLPKRLPETPETNPTLNVVVSKAMYPHRNSKIRSTSLVYLSKDIARKYNLKAGINCNAVLTDYNNTGANIEVEFELFSKPIEYHLGLPLQSETPVGVKCES